MNAVLNALHTAALQVDPNQGTLQAMQGAQQRINDPHYYDVVFPIIALMLVIVIPACISVWVAYKTITDKTLVDGDA